MVLNALDAQRLGATIMTRTRCTGAQRDATGWSASLENAQGVSHIRARALVNAAGPWAESFLRQIAKPAHGETLATKSLRLVKGSHIIVPKRFEHDHAYIFQNPDKRIIFAIPYETQFTLIGTTDVEVQGDPGKASISDQERDYLCEQASRYFKHTITPADVVWSYAGVRPLLEDDAGNPSAVTRDYLLETHLDGAPLLSVWGGKITTFRKLAEDAADLLCQMLSAPRPAWTHGAFLPGGDLSQWVGAAQRPDLDFERFVKAIQKNHPWLPVLLARRLARAYGARIDQILSTAKSLQDLGMEIAPGLYEAELNYLCQHEWAQSAEDVLWRRSKLGLHLNEDQRDAVSRWMNSQDH
mgnify:FL=1